MDVYKLVLRDCQKCSAVKGLDRDVIGEDIHEYDFEGLSRGSYVYALLEEISDKNNLTSLSFPFYIFVKGVKVSFISGVTSITDLKTRYEELEIV